MRVKGHALNFEGRTRSTGGWLKSGAGIGSCECGVKSPELPSTAARQRWHRNHKAEVFVCESCGQPAGVTLTDGSFWCQSCDGSARRLGYAS